MSKLLTSIVLLLQAASVFSQKPIYPEIQKVIQDPSIFEINQLPGHASLLSFSLEEERFVNPSGTETGYLNLNGSWKFLWNPFPGLEPEGFYKPEFDPSGWNDIQVPQTGK
jgi:beta-galactosidase